MQAERNMQLQSYTIFHYSRIRPSECDQLDVESRAIKSKQRGSQVLSSIGSRTVGTAILFSDIDPGPYRNGRRYLASVNDYHHRLTTLSS
ncbi:hypothetical protein EVAR_22348_1 [Eumeta japonica]|uniref:Uncharacterized protein n=1 Tax=Eumeta variegata TaxID=151549 RepID=A0A4C1VJD7_EUMVA|nr:hypothetical protein EVAR_22348_1 [Eumeta japonica]